MTKDELIREVSRKNNIEKKVVETIVIALVNSIEANLTNKKSISLSGFGRFYIKRRAPKTARNIVANEPLYLPECFVPLFKPSKRFKEKIKLINK